MKLNKPQWKSRNQYAPFSKKSAVWTVLIGNGSNQQIVKFLQTLP